MYVPPSLGQHYCTSVLVHSILLLYCRLTVVRGRVRILSTVRRSIRPRAYRPPRRLAHRTAAMCWTAAGWPTTTMPTSTTAASTGTASRQPHSAKIWVFLKSETWSFFWHREFLLATWSCYGKLEVFSEIWSFCRKPGIFCWKPGIFCWKPGVFLGNLKLFSETWSCYCKTGVCNRNLECVLKTWTFCWKPGVFMGNLKLLL